MPVTLYDVFECTECPRKVRVTVTRGMKFPIHCGQVMRMLDGHELNKLLREKMPKLADVEEAPDGELIVVDEPAVAAEP